MKRNFNLLSISLLKLHFKKKQSSEFVALKIKRILRSIDIKRIKCINNIKYEYLKVQNK